MEKRKHKDWNCKRRDPEKNNGMEFECSSLRGKEISIFNNGSLRFNKDTDPVKVNGKTIKIEGEPALGVEID